MKTINSIKLVLVFFTLLFTNNIKAQDSTAISLLAKAISNRQFVFVPQTANPASGRTRQLTPDYNLAVKGDTLISYLPYFGRIYSLTTDAATNALDFTSVKYTCDVKAVKNKWILIIIPKDQREPLFYNLTIFNNANASLVVSGNNRQSISFNGKVAMANE